MGRKNIGRAALMLAVAGAMAAITVPLAAAAPATPTVSAHHHYLLHGLGAKVDAHAYAVHALPYDANVPDSYDLSQYALSPGDQGQVGSCVSWAIDYSAYGVLMNEQGLSGDPMAPMYTYAQIAQGNDQGSTPEQTFQILESQGVDTMADYYQGNYDYTTQPDQAEITNAANYKLSGYTPLGSGYSAQNGIEQAISSGKPVAITIQVHQSFEDMTQQQAQDYSYTPGDSSSDPILGGHEITIIGYNSQGVRVENSWGTNWGDGGFVNLSWQYVAQEVQEANAVGGTVG